MKTLDTQAELITGLIATFPCPEQIKDIDLTTDPPSIYFTWRSGSYKLQTGGLIYQYMNGCLVGNDICIVINELLKTYMYK